MFNLWGGRQYQKASQISQEVFQQHFNFWLLPFPLKNEHFQAGFTSSFCQTLLAGHQLWLTGGEGGQIPVARSRKWEFGC